jgi:hypothetical protein
MIRASLSLIALGLVSFGCNAPDATAPTTDQSNVPEFQGGGVVHRATAGSHDLTPPGVDPNYSLVAIQHADGRITGQYSDQFGQGEGGFHARVTCLLVVGNNAYVGGIITSDNIPDVDLEGVPVITRVQDNGTSANDPPDMISFSFIFVPDQACLTAPNLPLFPIQGGEVKVQ